MILVDPNINAYVTTNPLTPEQQQSILSSEHAMKGLPHYTEGIWPTGQYLKMGQGLHFWGAVRMEVDVHLRCSIHPLQVIPNKQLFTTFTELSIIYCLLHRLTPYTTVFRTPNYDYMRKYLTNDLGLAKQEGEILDWFYLPPNWNPRYVESFTVGDYQK